MELLRWILAISCLAYFGFCMTVLVLLAIRRVRTGKRASGLAFVGATVGFAGILIMPVSTFSARLPFALIPFLIESSYFGFDLLMDLCSTTRPE